MSKTHSALQLHAGARVRKGSSCRAQRGRPGPATVAAPRLPQQRKKKARGVAPIQAGNAGDSARRARRGCPSKTFTPALRDARQAGGKWKQVRKDLQSSAEHLALPAPCSRTHSESFQNLQALKSSCGRKRRAVLRFCVVCAISAMVPTNVSFVRC